MCSANTLSLKASLCKKHSFDVTATTLECVGDLAEEPSGKGPQGPDGQDPVGGTKRGEGSAIGDPGSLGKPTSWSS